MLYRIKTLLMVQHPWSVDKFLSFLDCRKQRSCCRLSVFPFSASVSVHYVKFPCWNNIFWNFLAVLHFNGLQVLFWAAKSGWEMVWFPVKDFSDSTIWTLFFQNNSCDNMARWIVNNVMRLSRLFNGKRALHNIISGPPYTTFCLSFSSSSGPLFDLCDYHRIFKPRPLEAYFDRQLKDVLKEKRKNDRPFRVEDGVCIWVAKQELLKKHVTRY